MFLIIANEGEVEENRDELGCHTPGSPWRLQSKRGRRKGGRGTGKDERQRKEKGKE